MDMIIAVGEAAVGPLIVYMSFSKIEQKQIRLLISVIAEMAFLSPWRWMGVS